MSSIPKKIINKLHTRLFPTEHDKEVKKWFADNGDSTLRLEYDLNEQSVVFDLGGYKGQWASDIYSRYNCHVLVFEPVKLFAKKIEERFSRNSKIKVFCLALGAKSRQELITLSEDGSSVYCDGSDRISVEFEDIASFFLEHEISTVDLMKINIEGGEYELMHRLIESELIVKIKNIQIQFHKISPNSDQEMKNILQKLKKTHSPTYQYRFVWENWVLRDA